MAEKPKCKLIGEDGNVFNIIGKVKKVLVESRMPEQAKKFVKEAMISGSYDEVLRLCGEYVEII